MERRAAARIALGLLGLAAVAARFGERLGEPDFSAANFFSYFTIESNLIAAVVLLVVGLGARAGRPASERLDLWRGAATLYIATTGVVYSALLAGDADNLLRWTNIVLHYVMPVAVVVDWALDRPAWRIPFRRALAWLIYPVLFVVYTLIRGEIAGWYPYPFVDVAERGYPAVAATVAVLAAALVAAIWALAATTGRRRTPARVA